jgi:tripartite-type tricarboxylate transporter receptor subunit TctC
MLKPFHLSRMFAMCVLSLASAAAFCQAFPTKPLRVMTTAVGGGNDLLARLVANGISGPLGQPVVVENRTIVQSIDTVSKAPPDGYHLLVSGGSLWITPLLQKTSYDALRDFSPISMLSRQVLILVIHPSVPAKSVKELIAFAKARPGELNYGSGPSGGSSHLAPELFKAMAGINIVRVPYKGSAPALTALISGEVHVAISDTNNVAPYVKAGRVRALAVTSSEPLASAPGLPTMAAAGVPGYESLAVAGAWTTAKTPAAIINRLNQEIVRAFNTPEVKERVLAAGEEVVASSPEQFAAFVKADIARMGKVIKDAGIRLE